MNRNRRSATKGGMNSDAYAGFLRLWITPPGREQRPSPEVEAYLRYLAETSPLSATVRRALNDTTDRAA